MNLQKVMPLTSFTLMGLLVAFFFYRAFGSRSTFFGAIIALASIGFFGWLVLDLAH